MSQSITKALFIMVAGTMTAILISTLFTMSKNATKSANAVSSKASTLVSQMNYYDLDRVDCRYVAGNEIQRIIECYYAKCDITLILTNRDTVHKNKGVTIEETCISSCGNIHKISDIYDLSCSNCYVKDDSQFYVVIKYDDNDKLEKITITEQ